VPHVRPSVRGPKTMAKPFDPISHAPSPFSKEPTSRGVWIVEWKYHLYLCLVRWAYCLNLSGDLGHSLVVSS
jgi:hypothetical protein